MNSMLLMNIVSMMDTLYVGNIKTEKLSMYTIVQINIPSLKLETSTVGLSKNVQSIVDNLDVSDNQAIERVENQFHNGGYDDAVEALISSSLSSEQKKDCYVSLIDRLGFTSFEVNGLTFNVPEHWYIRYYSDPNIVSAKYSEEDSPFSWYVKYMGQAEQLAAQGDDYWKTRDDFSQTTITGCADAYIRCDSGHDNKDELYHVIEHFVECDGAVYQLQYLAYEGRFYEDEVWMLLSYVEFADYAKNSENRKEQTYLSAIDLLNEEKYEEALSVFETLEGYKDSEDKITECNAAIIEEKYNNAIVLMNEGKYKDAIVIFNSLGDYKDAAELSRKYALLACETGDVITFGTYEQDNNLDNGAEAIEWIVLERNGNNALVISKYCIEWMPFNETFTHVTWTNSTIRSWLNQTFLNEAFTNQEKTSIIASPISNPDDPDDSNSHGTSTDNIFLLSLNEAGKYFSNDSARSAYGTDYACSKGESASWCWWLRSAGSKEYVAYVSSGEIGYYEEIDRNMGTRPVMWIEVGEN